MTLRWYSCRSGIKVLDDSVVGSYSDGVISCSYSIQNSDLIETLQPMFYGVGRFQVHTLSYSSNSSLMAQMKNFKLAILTYSKGSCLTLKRKIDALKFLALAAHFDIIYETTFF